MANPPYNILCEIMGRVQELSHAVAPLNQRHNTNAMTMSNSNSALASSSTSNQAQISTRLSDAVAPLNQRHDTNAMTMSNSNSASTSTSNQAQISTRLSNAVAPLNQRNHTNAISNSAMLASTNSQAQIPASVVEEEVSRVFCRHSSYSQENATPHVRSSRSSQSSAPLFGLRRHFQGRSGGSKPKKPKQPCGPFLRDVVLLTGPEDTIVPRQGVRVWLSEHGHILSGFEFYKEWNASQVELAIKEAFEGKIPAHTDFEILMSIHSTLVSPTLAPGQNGLNGVMIHRVFKGKPVYVRPVTEIVDSSWLPWSSQNNKRVIIFTVI